MEEKGANTVRTKGNASSLKGMMAKMVKGINRLVSVTARFNCFFSRYDN